MNQAELGHLVSKLRVRINPRHRNLKQPEGPSGRLKKLRKVVNGLFKYERLELNYTLADEARGYAERLISEAIRHGDTHKPTMEMADFWIEEKQLVHKLFKVLVPRFVDYSTSYTQLYRAPKAYPDNVYPRSVLELKGNPFPSILPKRSEERNFIHNVLLDEAKKAYRAEKYEEITKSLEKNENNAIDEVQ
ncbi:39S ribosomal protein L17, mitochondrial [Daktulosphaira vitifoliae]|uniref:39S ribosomal protein L17, mitochondrial n=1 Tax=Daktulosphaira vitifoliae TaxID=58002 RepID=UPI0021A9DE78|nr:39S ribosomal protein L17, mitochondrial [Daktulosphaira vitifoliae]